LPSASIACGVIPAQFQAVFGVLTCLSLFFCVLVQAEDNGDQVEFMFESPKQTRNSHFQMKVHDLTNIFCRSRLNAWSN
jgi:hypothetical protein